jgi:ABC-type uncharacterized transport system involved in gliding motility auxiliary subunit
MMDARSFFSRRKTRLGALSGTGVFLVVVGLTLLNLLSQRFFVRWDGSDGRRYSLSQASRRLVRGLPDPVLIRAYISSGFPPEYAAQARYVQDLLDEYRAASRGNVAVEIYDPESSEKVREDARRSGVMPVRITQVASDQFQMREGFLGLVMFHQDKQEALPFIRDVDGLEYDVSSRIRRMTRPTKKILGLVTGHREPSSEALRAGLGARLCEAFDVRPIVLSTSTPLTADMLLVMNPSSPFSDGEIAALDAAVSSGVPTAVFLSRVSIDMRSFAPMPRTTALENILAHYGARVREDIVLDAQCQQVSIQTSRAGVTVSNIVAYPPFIVTRPSRTHPLTRPLDSLVFPFAHPVVFSGGPTLTFTPLAMSSVHSWTPTDLRNYDPFSMRPPSPDALRGPFPLAAVVEGSTTSFCDPARAARVRLAVVGSGVFVDDGLPLPVENGVFLSGLADWLCQENDFLSIPTRGPSFRPIHPRSGVVRALVKAAGYFFLPLMVVAWGFLRWRRRCARRPAIQKIWESFRA